MDKFILVMMTAPTAEEAGIIAHALVEEKLAACANIFPVRSVYSWKGALENQAETMMTCKTKEENFPALERRVRELHSYEVPEIIALPIMAGSGEYLSWVAENARR